MKRYIRLYTNEWLDGSIRSDLTPAERSVWGDLMTMAGISRREGYIERSKGIAYSHVALASRFVIPLKLLDSCIAKCLNEGRLTALKDGTYYITNWGKYQAPQASDDGVKPKQPKESIPLSPEDKQASQQAAAARLAYLQPEAAKRGIVAKEFEQAIKKSNKKGGEQ